MLNELEMGSVCIDKEWWFYKIHRRNKTSPCRGLWILDAIKYIKLYAVKETAAICSI